MAAPSLARRSSGCLPPALLLLALLLAAAPALAHPVLESSSPEAGAALPTLPGNVSLTLSEPLDPFATTLQVYGPAGRVDEGPLRFAEGNRQVSVALRTLSGAGMAGGSLDGPAEGRSERGFEGRFEARWATLSREGHHVAGTVAFHVGANPAAGEPPTSEPAAGAWLTLMLAAARASIQAGTALALGAVALWAWLPGVRHRTLSHAVTVAAALQVAGTAALLALTTHAAALPLPALIATEAGQGLYARLLLGAAALAVMLPATLASRVRALAPAAAVALLAAAATRAAAMSHAATHGLAATAVHLMHTTAAGTWVGGLVILAWAATRDRVEPGEAVQAMGRRFGTIALACVVALVATGVMDTFAVAPTAITNPAQAMGPWWLALAGKAALLGFMLVVGGVNRFVVLAAPAPRAPLAPSAPARLQAALARITGDRLGPGPLAHSSFGRLVLNEAIAAIVVLGLAGLLATLRPP